MLAKHAFLVAFLAAFVGGRVEAKSAIPFDRSHALWTQVLAKYSQPDGKVRYRDLKAETTTNKSHPFRRYLRSLANLDKSELESWTSADQMAFWINAYNALTWKLIVDHYPLKSIKDLGTLQKSPWEQEFFSLLDGQIKALDAIEHRRLREQFRDFRIHAAVHNASNSCPSLQPRAFVGETLETQLETAFREFLGNTDRNHFDPQHNVLYLSKVFDWFEKDFETAGGIAKVVQKYGPPALSAALRKSARIRYATFDWRLNETDARDTKGTM